ncbi:MAG: ferritin-like domain-containing protein [Mucilaginibacter sp.]|uniref:YciE/YciF ferroxidase family protein n=1 Tax=Mucilaginibacter sp. TaxID=1882438 RepID=UPI0034E4AFC0
MATAKSKTAKKPERTPKEESALKELFTDELKDILWAENQLSKSLKKLAEASTSEELKKAFETHLTETEGQIERLKQVFEFIGEEAKPKKCEAMAGLAKEAEELIESTEEGTEVRDVALISAAQKCEHYEIATYGTLKTLAGVLGFTEAQGLLEQTLEEEKKTDKLLTQIAESSVNAAAEKE